MMRGMALSEPPEHSREEPAEPFADDEGRVVDIAPTAADRLDRVVAKSMDVSVGEARRMLERGAVDLNGVRVDARAKGLVISPKDQVAVRWGYADRQLRPKPGGVGSNVLAQAADAVIMEKRAGVAVHPLQPHDDTTLLNDVVEIYPQVFGVGEGGLRSGVVHRLDLEVSGCVAFALTQDAWARLREAVSAGKNDDGVLKRYHAVVRPGACGKRLHDSFDAEDGQLVRWLKVVRSNPAFASVVESNTDGARRCSLVWRWLKRTETHGLLQVDLHTGFLHQIRAMLADAGAPILGDESYGIDPPGPILLHAYQLRLPGIEAVCPWPERFATSAVALGLTE